MGAVYLSPAWEEKQTETDLAWDEPLDAVIAQIERTTEAWPGPGDVSTEFDVIDSDIAWIDSLGNEDAF